MRKLIQPTIHTLISPRHQCHLFFLSFLFLVVGKHYLANTANSGSPRTVNRMVNPYGFQFKGGRIVKDGDANLGTAATPDGKDKGVDVGNGTGNENGTDNGNHGENGMNGDDGTIDPSKIEKKQPATEARKGRGRPRKNPVAAKKRKLDVTEEEQVEDNGAVFQEGEV